MSTTDSNFDERAARARAMRAEGATYVQIKAALGVGTSAVSQMLGVAGTRRPRARISAEVREKARVMRRDGATVPDIARGLGMARSTAFQITKGIAWDLPPVDVERRREQARAYWREQNRRRAAAKDAAQIHAVGEVGGVSARELLLLGAVLYWAEGAKSKPWRKNDEYLKFINSDPDVIRVYLEWLVLLGIDRSRLQYRVMIHESADVAEVERYWAEVVGEAPEMFDRVTLKRHNPKTVRKNTGAGYKGCLIVRVATSTEEYWRMEGVWRGIVSSVANQIAQRQQEA